MGMPRELASYKKRKSTGTPSIFIPPQKKGRVRTEPEGPSAAAQRVSLPEAGLELGLPTALGGR